MGGFALIFGIVPIVVIVIVIMATSVRILRDYERAVIFRFGRRANAVVNPGGDGSGPGLVLLIPFIDKMVRVSLRTITTDVPSSSGRGHHSRFVSHDCLTAVRRRPRRPTDCRARAGAE